MPGTLRKKVPVRPRLPAPRYGPRMRIVGHGIDLVAVARVSEMLQRHPERFLGRCFTEAEAAYCDAGGRRRGEHLAARFAAKEAAVKALGTGFRGGVSFLDVEVTRGPAGRPGLRVGGEAARVAAAAGVTDWWLSLSHTDEHAIASVIAVAREAGAGDAGGAGTR